ncbi:DnaJ C-terminal domain-containing protein [Paenibacillus agricola]|uniref:DnaJ domain-containing protein n=1 Tax=Paenibacillus agricola TaxID=2716264 RepID=A0ABX0JIY1_9BACL|nr:DnaJ C-terminal domain-containing protein [Paenibacillus agricola]NHN34434.1 DnaJ domain-containing protein [Paenibacillus agricola]
MKKTKDHYEVLGVDRKATKDEIKKAYKKKAKAFHPDVNKSPEAEARFKEAQEAYEVLHDDESRTSYDQYGERWREGGAGANGGAGNFGGAGYGNAYGGGAGSRAGQAGAYGGTRYQTGEADYGDLFNQFFGGAGGRAGQADSFFSQEDVSGGAGGAREQQADEEATLHLTLEEIVLGGKVSVLVLDKKLSLTIPASVIDGQRLRLKGMGRTYRDGSKGDLYVTIKMKPDPVFTVAGYDLTATLEIAPWHAALGTEAKLKLRGGSTINVKVPPMGAAGGTGHMLRLTGKGLRKPDGSFGDLFVEVDMKLPQAITEKEQELYRELAKAYPMEPTFHGA